MNPSICLQVMLLFGCVYEFCIWLYYGASDDWVYRAEDWQTNKPVLVYLLLPMAYVVLFFAWYACQYLSLFTCMIAWSH